jgi:hypothetical protein
MGRLREMQRSLAVGQPMISDHPHTDPGDGRTECNLCGKFVWAVTHSCKGVPVTAAAEARMLVALERVKTLCDEIEGSITDKRIYIGRAQVVSRIRAALDVPISMSLDLPDISPLDREAFARARAQPRSDDGERAHGSGDYCIEWIGVDLAPDGPEKAWACVECGRRCKQGDKP